MSPGQRYGSVHCAAATNRLRIAIMEPIIMTLMGGTTLMLLGQVWSFVDHQLTQWKGRIG